MDDTPSSEGRSKRQRVDKAAKFEKLKQLKGSKHKYEVTEVENVYEEVDEDTYTEKVLERQEDDWIVDDDGSGYVEDGREIFDDDLDDESVSRSKKSKGDSRKRGRPKVEKTEVTRPAGGNIRNMFANMPTKKRKECSVKLEDDDILGDLMNEIDKKSTTPKSNQKNGSRSTPQSEKTEMSSRDYLKSFSTVPLKPKPVKASIVTTSARSLNSSSRPDSNGYLKTNNFQPDEVAAIDDNFTEDFESLPPMDIKLTIKQEPEDVKPVIEDFDSNDGFADAAFQEVDKVIEEFESQATEPQVQVKQEIKQEKYDEDEMEKENMLMSGVLWDNVEIESKSQNSTIQLDLSKLPLTTNENGDKVFRFFYLDAYEDMFKQPGTVYLFGKVAVENSFASCCVVMKNIDRTIYLLPREEFVHADTEEPTGKPVLQKNVYEEFNNEISTKYKITAFRSRFVTKHYAFELDDVPRTCEYFEVRYSPSLAQLPKDLKGETFSHVFGTNSSFLELLLLQRKIKGPCWLDLSEPTLASNPVSNCKIEVVGSHIRNISVSSTKDPPPPLVLASLTLRASLHEKTNQVQIIMASVAAHHTYSVDKQPNPRQPYQEFFCAFSRPSDSTFPLDLNEKLKKLEKLNSNCHRCNSERELLSYLLAKLSKLDPDLVVGHGLMNGDLNLLVQRLYVLKVPKWHRIGRLHRAEIPPPGKARFQVEKYPMPGRLICDIKVSAKELIKSRSYDLGTLCRSLLKMKEEERPDITLDEVKSKYDSGSTLLELIKCTVEDAVYVLKIMYELNVIPLALQITNIAGNVLSRTLMGGRAERNEFLLMHAFTEKDYIIPDKQYGKKPVKDEGDDWVLEEEGDAKGKKGRRKKPQYSGGLVLDPKVGFYDKLVLLMDFNSLYPSIIHEYNICFTTVRKVITTLEEGIEVTAEPPDTAEELGILPTEIRKLVESRREVKKLMKSSGISQDLRMQYDIRQMALKLTANSMYGCLGFSNSRFCAKPLAALVTAKGREILTNTKDLVQKLNYEVIYGDTDSIMINTNNLEFKEVFKIGNKIKSEVNKMYKHVELDIDGVFRFMLLLKKKKYAAVTLTQLPSGEVVETQEIKGLDIVRRDWSQLAAEAGKFVLNQILSDQDPDERIQNIHTKMEKLREDLAAGDKVPMSLLTITKQLTRNPEEYSDSKSQPHVLVALRMNKKGARLKSGDTVHYVICEDGTENAAMQRAYHVDEMKSLKLKLDVKYYLAQQIHPVVTRLIEPIDGTSASQIASCLGLDPSQYKERPKPSEELGVGDTFLLNDTERFKHCEKFIFTCANPDCRCENAIDSPIRKMENERSEFVLEKCVNPDCSVQPMQYLPHIQNCLSMSMRNYITKYYQGWLICEDPACFERTRKVPLKFENNFPVCSTCEINSMYREYSEKQLYTQLSYLQHLFDISKPPHSSLRVPVEVFNAYCTLKEHIARTLACSDYAVVNLTEMFRGIYPEPIKIKQEPQDESSY